MDKIKLAHGNGGTENNELISKVFYKAFENDIIKFNPCFFRVFIN